MKSVTQVIEKPFSKPRFVSVKKIVAMIREAKKDPEFIEAAREFYKYHTGRDLKLSK